MRPCVVICVAMLCRIWVTPTLFSAFLVATWYSAPSMPLRAHARLAATAPRTSLTPAHGHVQLRVLGHNMVGALPHTICSCL